MKTSKLAVLGLVLLACAGCDARDGMVLTEPPTTVMPESSPGRSIVEGMEDVLDDVERTARDIGRRAEETLK